MKIVIYHHAITVNWRYHMSEPEIGQDALSLRVGLLRKLNAMRKSVLKLDWKPDKSYAVKGNIVPYVSFPKMKAQIAPLLADNGIELFVDFGTPVKLEPLDRMPQHWMISMTITLMDIDTGFAMYDRVYGEAGDMGDKGIGKACSYAFKQWMAIKFMISDGIELDEPDDSPEPVKFVKRTKEEEEEVRSKVLSQGMKVPQPETVEKAPESPVTAPEEKKEEEPTEEPVAVPEPAEAPAEDPAPKRKVKPVPDKVPAPGHVQVAEPVPAPEPEPEPEPAPADPEPAPAPPAKGFKPVGPQAKAIERITQEWEKRAKEGLVSVESYNEMSMACASIASAADAVAFIKKFRVG